MHNDKIVKIFVALINEPVDVWRPVKATQVGENSYLIVNQEYDSDIETWQFKPGERVRCEYIQSSDGMTLAAVSRID